MQLYENHVIADASTLELNFRKAMDDCDLLAITMSTYVNNPNRYRARDVVTEKAVYDNNVEYNDFSRGVNINSPAVRKDIAVVNNIKDLLKNIESQYKKLPISFYVISKSGYCLSINSNVESNNGNQFSFLALNQDKKNFECRELPAYTIHDNSNVKVEHGLVTEVFENNGEPVVSYSTPFFDSKGFAGVVAFDVSLTDLTRFSYRQDEDHEWKFFFMDKTGRIRMSTFDEGIFSVSADLSLKQIANADIKALVSNVNNDRSGISLISMDGTSYYVAFSTVPSLNGYLADVYFEDDIKKALKASREQLFDLLSDKNDQIFSIIGRFRIASFIFLVLMLLISLTIAYKVVKKYTSPIELISQEI
ncbi:MAG: cache domain-containing protein, partial [Succinivibrio sp.]|nr:cache domain-containing protein [Succinivibrio sp.]